MTALSQWLADGAFHAPLYLVAAVIALWFCAIYVIFAGGAHALVIDRLPQAVMTTSGHTLRMHHGQIRREIALSALSIVVFTLQGTLLVYALRKGWLIVTWDRPLWHLLWELPIVYVWNEVYFFLVHRLLHRDALYRSVHVWHHRSVLTTTFSAYSFHPLESFLLGAVLPLALVFHAFSPWALLGLTVMSLLLNVSGHLPQEGIRDGWSFVRPHSRYHNRHHREFNVHFGFSFAPLDRWFGGADSTSPGA